MRKPVKYFLYTTATALILAVFFVFGLPAILKVVLKSQLTKNLNRPVSVESVSFNPFKLCLTVKGLSVREKGSDLSFVSIDQLRVNAEIVSVYEGGIDLSEVSLVNPSFRLVRTEKNDYNFSDLLTDDKKKSEEKTTKPVLFSVANIKIAGGSIEFNDKPKKAVHSVTDIELNLPLISNFKHHLDQFVQPTFSATINGRPFKLIGQSKPFADSLETSAEINITDLSLAQYLPYVPAILNFKMPSGRLSTSLVVSYIQSARKAAEVKVQGTLKLEELEIVSIDDKPIFKLPSMGISGIDCRINDRNLVVGNIAVEGLSLTLAREKDGSISLQKLVGIDNQTGDRPVAAPQPSEPEWRVKVKKFELAGGAVSFEDLLPAQPVLFRIDPIDLTFKNISTVRDSLADLDLRCLINGESALSLQGGLMLVPMAANLDVVFSDFNIRTVQSYLPGTLQLDITGGNLGLKGNVDFKQREDADPAIIWQGGMKLVNFAAARKGEKEDLAKISSLDFKSMHIGTRPLFLNIKTVKLAGLFLRPVLEKDGTMNLSSLSDASEKQKPGSAAESPEKELLPDLNIGRITLEKGRVLFVDKSIKPRYSAELADIQGRISGISTKPDSPADIKMNAKLNRYAPFKLTGTIKPLQEKLDADIKIIFDNIDMSPFSPYSGKFIGRLVEKGSLSFDLAYTIQDNQLTSQNKVFIDQLTLGKSVKSPDATSLPVGLAVSLLKDRKGRIELDLPVSGRLDDPSFRAGKVILQILVNLIQKAATSPFALMGKLIPGGVDISRIAFTCGMGSMNDEIIKKLDVLAGILGEKKDLTLEIQAVAVTALDRECLREEMVMHQLRLQKYYDLSRKEKKELNPSDIVISSEEYDKYLRKAYRAEKFQKPKGMLGLNKRLPVAEMKQLMLENTVVDDADLKDLLHQRGLSVKQYLVETHKIPAERLFILDSRFDSGNVPENSCVEFDLR